ncbi:MAG: alpha/beta hydrolase [Solirubrobacteraceae bacterium]
MIEETRRFNAELERRLAAAPAVHTLPLQETRRLRSDGGGPFSAPVRLAQARTITIAARSGELCLRVLAPERPRGTYLHIHGGGWTFGAADQQDEPLWALSTATGLTAISVDYRLAPEHPHPASAEDCEDAGRWLLDSDLGDGFLAIGGESSGAHLALLTLLRLRDAGARGRIHAATLVSGWYDVSLTPSARLWGDRQLVLSTPTLRWLADNLCGSIDPERRRDPSVSPLFADMHDLPPCLITVGTLDPLLDDSLFLHARLRAAGNPVALHVVDEAIHGFNLFPIAAAREAAGRINAFLGIPHSPSSTRP